jgi:hypothetical protein
MSKKIYVDPPEGWKYGFPKVCSEHDNIIDFIIDSGYPEELVDENFTVRIWTKEEDDE